MAAVATVLAADEVVWGSGDEVLDPGSLGDEVVDTEVVAVQAARVKARAAGITNLMGRT